MLPNEAREREMGSVREIGETPTLSGTTLTGYAIVFGVRSHLISEFGEQFYEMIDRGAFSESIAKQNITFVAKHDDDAVYGDTASGNLRLTEDEKGIRFELKIPPYANRLRAQVEQGLIKGMSFKFYERDVYIDDKGIRHVRRGELAHISSVYNPAYPTTSIKVETPNNELQKAKLKLLELHKPT